MRTTLLAVLLAVLGATSAPASTGGAPDPAVRTRTADARSLDTRDPYPRVRIWVENDRDYYRRGDRMRVSFSTSTDAYVAVVHVDPDGNLDFLFPRSPWDEEYVRGGRTYSLPAGGWQHGISVRGRGGIGYLYIVASPAPLDYRYFRSRGTYGWDWSYAGRTVRGDPFWALEQLTRMLIPDWSYAPYVADYHSYHVDGPQRYPSYACADWGGGSRSGWGWSQSWGHYYGACDRLDLFLRDHPHYFDSRRYRGDRRHLFRDYGPADPRHGYKESPRESWSAPGGQVRHPSERRYYLEGESRAPREERATPQSRPAPDPEPAPRRPSTERRPAEGSAAPSRGRVVQPRATPPAQRAPSATPRSRRPEDGSSTSANEG